MDRYDFMWRLKSLLSDIPEQEREEALQYYNDYFEDAGRENEASVIEALGGPERVAENIKRDAGQNLFFDQYEESKVEKGNEIIEYSSGWEEEQKTEKTKKELSGGLKALLVILGIFAFPVLLPLGLTAIGIMLAIVGIGVACVAVIGSIGITALSLFIAAFICMIVGVMAMTYDVSAGLGILAIGFILVAVGLLILVVTVAIGGLIPKLFQGIGWLFRTCFGRKKKRKS